MPGLLLIGDAAHVMSPVGGVGINYAIQDAVVAANLLARPLLEGRLEEKHLAEVQRQREFPTRFIQGFQAMMQKRVSRQKALSRYPPDSVFTDPILFIVRNIPLDAGYI
jgi:2-polyprenyl-6-methoxyphenol hydroxylase-like FAD-dependent oxidoreductase